MITIDTTELGDGKKKFCGEEPGDMLDLGEEPDLRVDGPVQYDLSAEMADETLVVRGTVGVDIAFACVRCGVFFPKRVTDSSFCRVFEDTSDEMDAADLTADVRETIILAFPTGPLCDDGCKGLCSGCGTNLNKAACECKPEPMDERWRALDGLNQGN